MRVAVITPYYKESDEILRQCHESVAGQTYACTHFLVSDGFPNPIVDRWNVEHIRLPKAHADNGNAARCIGAVSAFGQGFDAVAFLDADNWYDKEHIKLMVELQEGTGASVCTASRTINRLDGSFLGNDTEEVDGTSFADTSCLFVHRSAEHLIGVWGLMPRELGPLCDRVMWGAITARRVRRAHSSHFTVHFRTQYANHYAKFGETPPPGIKTNDDIMAPYGFFLHMPARDKAVLLLGSDHWVSPQVSWRSLNQLVVSTQPPLASSKNLTVKHPDGRSITLTIPEDDGAKFVAYEIFRDEVYRIVPGLEGIRSILDIGANVGMAAAYFKMRYPQATIHCFEPDARLFPFLTGNLGLVGGGHVYNLAIGGANSVDEIKLGTSSVQNSMSSSAPESRYAALVYMIDAAVVMRQIGETDIVKLDTEGGEVVVLARLAPWYEAIKAFYIEYHSERDRRVIDAMLSATHVQWYAQGDSPHRGTVCYVSRRHLPADIGEPELM